MAWRPWFRHCAAKQLGYRSGTQTFRTKLFAANRSPLFLRAILGRSLYRSANSFSYDTHPSRRRPRFPTTTWTLASCGCLPASSSPPAVRKPKAILRRVRGDVRPHQSGQKAALSRIGGVRLAGLRRPHRRTRYLASRPRPPALRLPLGEKSVDALPGGFVERNDHNQCCTPFATDSGH